MSNNQKNSSTSDNRTYLVTFKRDPNISDTKTQSAYQRTQKFRDSVQDKGYLSISSKEIIDQTKGLLKSLPEGITANEILTGIDIYSKGGKGDELVKLAESKFQDNPKLLNSFIRIGFVAAALQDSNHPDLPSKEDIALANGNPSLDIEEVRYLPENKSDQTPVHWDGSVTKPWLQESVNQISGEVKNHLLGALKQGGSKLVRSGAPIAEKVGLKMASGALKSLIVNAVSLISGAGLLVRAALKALPLLLGKAFNNIRRFIEDNKGAIALGGILGGLMGAPVAAAASAGVLLLSGGFPLLIGGLVGVGTATLAFVGFLANAAALPATVVFSFLGFAVLTVFMIIIINLGAYVAPLGNLGYTPGDCLGDPPPKPEVSGVKFSSDGNFAYPVAPYSGPNDECYHWDDNPSADLFSGTPRSPLVAYESGEIVNVTLDDPIGGKYVILRGASGRHYYYAHLCHVFVTGGSVEVGEVIGTMDETGTGRVEHLHFAINAALREPKFEENESDGDFFWGGDGNICPFIDFEEKFNEGVCDITESCILPANRVGPNNNPR